MWVTTHVFAGLGIAAALGGPWWLLVALVVAAHVVMDLIPHWDYTVSKHALLCGGCDLVASSVAFGVAWLVLGYPWWIAFIGLVSGAPDLDVLFWLAKRKSGRKYFLSHWDRFPHGRSGPVWGIGVQVVIMAASAAVVLALRP
jgi:hypothetical protein